MSKEKSNVKMLRVLKLGLDLSPDSSLCTLHGHASALNFVAAFCKIVLHFGVRNCKYQECSRVMPLHCVHTFVCLYVSLCLNLNCSVCSRICRR